MPRLIAWKLDNCPHTLERSGLAGCLSGCKYFLGINQKITLRFGITYITCCHPFKKCSHYCRQETICKEG